MVKKLTKLRIDEISSVDHGAGEGCRVMLYKRDDGDVTDDDPQRTNTTPDDDKVSGKLRSMVDAMIVAAPSLDRQTATHFLLHSAQGRKLAEHLNNLSKGETPMPQVDITKLHNIDSVTEIAKNVIDDKVALTEHQFTEILQGHAKLAGTTLEKILTAPNNGEIRKAYTLVKGYQPAG
jgi:hypothetical protein